MIAPKTIKTLSAVVITFIFIFISLIAINAQAEEMLPNSPFFTDTFSTGIEEESLKIESGPEIARSNLVSIDHNMLPDTVNSVIELNLFEDVSYTAVFDQVKENASGSSSWIGRIEGEEYSSVTLVIDMGTVTGNITVKDKFYQIRFAGNGVHAIYEVDQSAFPDPLEPLEVVLDPFAPVMPDVAAGDDGSIIDIMVVYTDDARAASANITAEIQTAIDETNESYANSGITQRLNLVYSAEVNYAETGDMYTDLACIQSTSDGCLDIVHTWRDTYGADAVSFWIENAGPCGLGYVMQTVSNAFAPNAFSVVRRTCATGYYSFGHELGHNMGAAHDRANASVNGAYSYSYGYQDPSENWRTIMAYNCPTGCTRVRYWSNPDVLYSGVPMGVPVGQPTEADNRMTLDNTAFTFANFRQGIGGGEDNYEENDTRATAYYPGSNWEQTWLSSIDGSGIQADDDWYQIDVTAGDERVQIDLQFTHADGDINLALYDSLGNPLANSDSSTDNESIDYTVSGPGTYFIWVGNDNAGNSYDLWWNDSSPPLPPVTISGYVHTSGGSGINSVTMSGASCSSTDGTGYYSCSVASGWSGTITPSLTGYTFSPASRNYSNVISNQTDQDYTGTPPVTISGYVRTSGGSGINSVTMSGASCSSTDGTGYYSCSVASGWSGTITPSLIGYTFSPASRNYSNVISNQANQNYTGTISDCVMTFNDVPLGHWARTFISDLACANVTVGCGGGNYCPDDDVSRKQMAVFIIKAMGQTSSGAAYNAYFDDIANDGYAPYINRMYELGITAGCATRTYCPNDAVNRAEMAVFIIKAMGQTPSIAAYNAYFDDIANDGFAPYINSMFELGITAGCATRTYCPNDAVNRAEMAVFLVIAFNL